MSTAGRGTRRGPIRLIIAGSLLTGAVLAAVLPLVVFGGGSEAVITGSALLGFAAGWAMLAAARRPADRPAAAVGLGSGRRARSHRAGAAGDDPGRPTLTAAGWVWPPLLLALAVWIGVPGAPLPGRRQRPLAALPRRGGDGRRGRRRRRRDRRTGHRSAHLLDARPALRRRRPPAAPGLHRLRQPDRGADERVGWDLGGLGPDRAARRRHHPGLRLRPRRAGMERGRLRTAGRGGRRQRICTPCWPAPARTARTCWSGTPSAATTR